MPPWGWWPAAFVGIAMIDMLLANQSRRTRFGRMWLAAFAWFAPATLWLWDLTPPGYPIAVAWFALLFGIAAAVVPPGRGRRLALPGTFVLAELIRWVVPFGGVPLAHLGMSQAGSPLALTARLFGSLLIVALVVLIGVALSALVQREWRATGGLAAVIVTLCALAGFAPHGQTVESIDVAIVQGGGQQRTRASVEGAQIVFDRHVAATKTIDRDVDLIMWPENVVNPVRGESPDEEDQKLYKDEARPVLSALAVEYDAVLIPGWFTQLEDGGRDNFSEVIEPNGEAVDRYDKVRIVPFGEFVPLRSIVERFSEDVPGHDVVQGTEPAVLDSSLGPLGISISWEVFFEHRGRDAAANGGRVLLNPTNGSSYWLTILQTQQVASSRLRAIESGRWVLQAAPTGFSAVVSPRGRVVDRTAISEQKVLYATIGLREGKTIATRWGYYPMVTLSLLALAVAWRASGAPDSPRRQKQ